MVDDAASKGAMHVAKTLDQMGVRAPERPMSIADIESELAERTAAERERQPTMLVIAGVAAALFVVVRGAILIASGP